MSKILEASCAAGVVLADNFPVATATILSDGTGPSDGILIMEEDEQWYIADTTPDLEETLDNLIDALGDIKSALNEAVSALNSAASALTSIDTAAYIKTVSGGSGAPAVGVPSPPVATSNISQVQSKATSISTILSGSLTTTITQLTTLKGTLK